ncbi:hypothetical protein Tco_0146193 [Tanacetum coccineum]
MLNSNTNLQNQSSNALHNAIMEASSKDANENLQTYQHNLRTSSNTSRANQDNSTRINRRTGYDNQRAVNVTRARETIENEHPEQPDSSNDIYLAEHSDTNITIDLLIEYDKFRMTRMNTDDLIKNVVLLAFFNSETKCAIDDNKNRITFESSTRLLVDKLKVEIERFSN